MSADAEGGWIRVCPAEDLRMAGRLERLVGRRAVLLLWHEGAPFASDALCPHAFAPLVDGVVADGRIRCTRHMASFDLATGEADAGWRLPPLAIHRARVAADWIEVRLS